ncbi:hypothetical protein BST55_07695 [Vibrio vulnificus]|nr:hypothetical protein [Vibrio vulnificus]OZS53126.1 hypothetical protein BST51_11815 [Vibrio vulnificus]OZS59162.1 hypothetical protein BST52_04990 [Vibrio vulnificus]OZS62543.1 hypothetical protein BST56_09705 [Vibrio vulnificus]PAO27289.1 hypothetical protein BTT96_11135 [Vibrio vulnificus]
MWGDTELKLLSLAHTLNSLSRIIVVQGITLILHKFRISYRTSNKLQFQIGYCVLHAFVTLGSRYLGHTQTGVYLHIPNSYVTHFRHAHS